MLEDGFICVRGIYEADACGARGVVHLSLADPVEVRRRRGLDPTDAFAFVSYAIDLVFITHFDMVRGSGSRRRRDADYAR